MKCRDLRKRLRENGWEFESGGKHDLATNPAMPGVQLTIPRHKEISEPLAKAILKAAGLK